jgi:hypothetical protein
MVDLTTIGVISTSLNTAINIVRGMSDIRDATLFQGKVFELQRALLDTQQSMFAANDERTALVERVRSLENKIYELKDWEAEKAKYELRQLDPNGVYAYAYKQGPDRIEPPHFICVNCYENGEKSVVQATPNRARGKRVHACPKCRTEIAFGAVPIGELNNAEGPNYHNR